MQIGLYQLNLDGPILARGFWLYICEIVVSDGQTLHYVGRTGDKASGARQSLFDRVSKHLGHNMNNNALRGYLGRREISPEQCSFRVHACRPFSDIESTKTHGELCDIASSLEKALADAMAAAGYTVINTVSCRIEVDAAQFAGVRAAFVTHFNKLASGVGTP